MKSVKDLNDQHTPKATATLCNKSSLKIVLIFKYASFKKCKLHPSWQKETADCSKELSWINVALTFMCHVFDADTLFTESEKPLLLQRNFLYVMMQPAWHSTFISNLNGVCTPAPGLLGQGSFPPLQRVSEGQGRSCMERTAVSTLRTAQAVMQRHLVNEQLKTWC